MRSFYIDRPTQSNLACTMDACHFQYEADAIYWGYTHQGGTTHNSYWSLICNVISALTSALTAPRLTYKRMSAFHNDSNG